MKILSTFLAIAIGQVAISQFKVEEIGLTAKGELDEITVFADAIELEISAEGDIHFNRISGDVTFDIQKRIDHIDFSTGRLEFRYTIQHDKVSELRFSGNKIEFEYEDGIISEIESTDQDIEFRSREGRVEEIRNNGDRAEIRYNSDHAINNPGEIDEMRGELEGIKVVAK